jgi:zinc protease
MDFKTSEEKLRAAFVEFETRGVTEDDLTVVKSQVIRSAYSRMNGVQSKAETLSHFHMMKGNGYTLQDEIDRYAAVTKEDVMKVYNKYIKNKKSVIMRVDPEMSRDKDDDTPKSVNPHAGTPKVIDKQYKGLTYNPPVDEFDRSVKPTIETGKAVQIPEFYSGSYDNGLKYIGTQSSESPMVYLYLNIEGGHLIESVKGMEVGKAMLTGSLIGEGTAELTTEELSRELDKLGSSIRFNSGTSSTTMFVSMLKENVDATLTLVEGALLRPRFDKGDFKRIKKQAIDGLRNLKGNPSLMADIAFNKLMFKGSILEDYYYGNASSLDDISLEDVKAFYAKYYSPNLTNMVISGDISKEEILPKLGFLSSWKNTGATVPELAEFQPAKGKTIYLVDKPYAAQSTVVVGQHSRPFDYNGEFFKSNVMNFTLGGAFSSRINLNLREDKGYTYGARSFFVGNKRYGYYKFSAEIKKEATDSSISELMKEIEGFKSGGITEEELAFTKSSMTLSEALKYETPFQKLGFLNRILEYDLPADYTTQQANLIHALNKAEIDNVAQSSLSPDDMIIIVVGHSYKIKDGLKSLGYKVKEIEID